jgi:intracellular sulfur oxidation DsrE/DsrF family protein
MRTALFALALLAASVSAQQQLGPPVEFPNVPPIPLPAGVDFDNPFKPDEPVRIVFGVAEPGKQMRESLTNAAYSIMYLKPRGVPYEIEFVLYARAVLVANQFGEEFAGHIPLMEALHAHGVQFRVCNNAMGALGVAPADVLPFMKITPAGILAITRKQMEGFHYISNPDGAAEFGPGMMEPPGMMGPGPMPPRPPREPRGSR